MSLRAIKKREQQLNTAVIPSAAGPAGAIGARQRLFNKGVKSNNATSATAEVVDLCRSEGVLPITRLPLGNSTLQEQRQLLGRNIHSNPELSVRFPTDTLERFAVLNARLVRTKSESDVIKLKLLLNKHRAEGNSVLNGEEAAATITRQTLSNAKSEVCLHTISSHSYNNNNNNNINSNSSSPKLITKTTTNKSAATMLSGARSHRDLAQSGYMSATPTTTTTMPPLHRRSSECSYQSSQYSQPASVMSTSTLSSTRNSAAGMAAASAENTLRVPIIGYEVMEERARFTVYKLRVENPLTNDCWLVLRRYTDFVRLNTKLKQAFPHITLMLPRKKIFGDNFNAVFLDNRVQGLQIFVNSIMAREELRKCKLVREFFCLDEPPSYSESMEECRAIFEAQEETIAHLKMQINNKDDLIISLQRKLREEIIEKEQLKETLANCIHCSNTIGATAFK